MMRRTVLLPILLLSAAASAADAGSIAALPGSTPLPGSASLATPAQDWQLVREVAGVPVEARPTETGFDAHRARALVCTDLPSLEAFVVDPSHFVDWVAYTRSARLLEHNDESAVYYVRSTTPWPLKDRDMVYRIARAPATEGVRLALTGLPDYAPEVDSATRIRAAAGEWRLTPAPPGIAVSYELYLDPGRAPRFLANQRLAAAVGQTLANLVARFPCTKS